MRRPKPLGVLITALGMAAATAAGAPSGDEESALRLLVKAFDRVSPKNVDAVMRMSMDTSDERQTVQVQIARDGRQRVEVVAPLHRARMIILELGEIRQIYNPDKRTLSTGRSMTIDLFDPSERLRLVRRNYTVRITRNLALANLKNVVRIDATSRYPDVGGASIFVDPESYFVLRVDSVMPSGERIKRFDTTKVTYPASLDSSTFKLDGVDIGSTIMESDPVPVRTLDNARRLAGFTALAPHALPYGFVVRKMYVNPKYKTISFNVSDGLAAATVYQLDLRNGPADKRGSIRADMSKRPDDFFSSGDIVVGIVSNLGPKARRRLLEAFRRPRRTSLNDTENFFIDGGTLDLSLGIGTISPCVGVTTFRRMWRIDRQVG
jgi:outer membrane lipoprotein-sorting protein